MTRNLKSLKGTNIPQLREAVSGTLQLGIPPRISLEKSVQIVSRTAPLDANLVRAVQQQFQGSDDDKLVEWRLPNNTPSMMSRQSFKTLKDVTWLNDEVVNSYADLLNMEYYYNNPSPKKSYVTSSALLAKLENRPEDYDHVVRKWCKEIDFFNLDKLVFLYNIENRHWALVYANIPQKRIEYIDSIGTPWSASVGKVYKFLNDVHETRLNKGVLEGWMYYCYADTTPQQSDGYNCGVFTIAATDYILSELPLHAFEDTDMLNFRNKIGHCLLQNGASILTLSGV